MILNLCAGPGGVDRGAAVLGLPPLYGVDLDGPACATAQAAGYLRVQADISTLDPDLYEGVTGVVVTPPCPPFSAAGLGKGRRDLDLLRGAMTALANSWSGLDDDHHAITAQAADPRAALVVETLRWAMWLPNARWVLAEQVPGVAPLWQEAAAELAAAADWTFLAVLSVAAEDLGVASRRNRTFLLAARDFVPDLAGLPMRSLWTTGRFMPPEDEPVPPYEPFPTVTMAAALGWPVGEWVNTRGNRAPGGGNHFSADGPSWCLTEKARTWFRVSDGLRLTSGEAGLLMGFPADYPWEGSRSRQFLQAADAVSPVVAAAVLGALLGLDWRAPVEDYLAFLYPMARWPGWHADVLPGMREFASAHLSAEVAS